MADQIEHDEAGAEAESRQSRQEARQNAITDAVMAAGTIRIADLAERFEIQHHDGASRPR